MPPEEQDDVTVLDSLSGNEGKETSTDEESQSAEGKKPSSESEKKIRENLRAEYDRKAKETVERERTKLATQYEDKIKDILNKRNFTASDQDKIDALQKRILEIRTHPDFAPWDTLVRQTVKEEMERAESVRYDQQHNQSQSKAEKWLQSRANELKISVDELGEELMPFLEDRYLDHLPEDRVRMAYEQLNRVKARYLKSGKEPRAEFAEGEGRVQRKVTSKEAITDGRKTGNWKSLLGAVAEKQNSEEK